jgi:hypothetical protein
MFQRATKLQSKARICLMGPTGSGKTFTALSLAEGLGKKVALIDSEHGSASKYADKFAFETCSLKSFSPVSYVAAIQAAYDFDVLIIDSISHEWAGKDGCLEQVNLVADSSSSKNSYTAWGKVTPKHNEFVDALLAFPGHLIATMRVKMDYVLEKNEQGKTVPVKVGLGPIQRDGVEYEFDILAQLSREHTMTIIKTRYSALDGGVYAMPDKRLGEEIARWLGEGAAPVVVPKVSKQEMAELGHFATAHNWSTDRLKGHIRAKLIAEGLDPDKALEVLTPEILAEIRVDILESQLVGGVMV